MAKDFTPPTERERSKYRAAEAAGLLDRVLEVGWAGLSAKESGRIGGLMSGRMRKKRSI
ncbi:MAG: spore protein [Clostridiales bacterium]|nr:spore protein [Clostridiales bacterium]